MAGLKQSPTEPEFVQNPYPFYASARAAGHVHLWDDYAMPAVFTHEAVSALLKDKRFGREIPTEMRQASPAHLTDFYGVEDHSMLELEAPRHTRLRSLVLRAFTSRRIKGLAPEIERLSHHLIDEMPLGGCDLLPAYCAMVPVIVIARLLGVPEGMATQLLLWSNAMVGMYQAGRTHDDEVAANTAAREFSLFMRDYIADRRATPADDLISELIAAEENGQRLTVDEMITTCILLLNAGHEATVHTLGNGVKALIENNVPVSALQGDAVQNTVEEILRYDPPLHVFTRYAYEDISLFGHDFRRGDQVALMLASANRDPAAWTDPDRFDPTRPIKTNSSFGGGIHFCIGAPLARLEMQIALRVLFERRPRLALAGTPEYADVYHFHGLEALNVTY
ncbi:cytochrome P450 [Donghicola sp. C2-DW-16]|uniref:Cytochrome P450 n=1 Tax=Donghicola mangrovi TaxID=2729614 RepID=A0ABX2PDH2_9RHOB|nr:cytochrome P450 [Donghicola mangrovi]NVO27006.1 cytochrome P450 [Donghicola mangrovi]